MPWQARHAGSHIAHHCRNPAHGDVFLSASGDRIAKVWDVRQPRSTLSIAAHAGVSSPFVEPLDVETASADCAGLTRRLRPMQEVLAADWCKYNDCVIATGGTDHTIKTWDVRMPQKELTSLLGHTLAVRRWMHLAAGPAACRNGSPTCRLQIELRPQLWCALHTHKVNPLPAQAGVLPAHGEHCGVLLVRHDGAPLGRGVAHQSADADVGTPHRVCGGSGVQCTHRWAAGQRRLG
jgi:hypothetical protein